jgi:hypothetical protein
LNFAFAAKSILCSRIAKNARIVAKKQRFSRNFPKLPKKAIKLGAPATLSVSESSCLSWDPTGDALNPSTQVIFPAARKNAQRL